MSHSQIGLVAIGIPVAMFAYAYVGYPLILWILAAGRRDPEYDEPDDWPMLSVSLVAHNEEAAIGATLDALLEADYPSERLQIVVTSDASSDRTDEIVRGYAARGVELLRLEQRGGKTAAENSAAKRLRGDIVLNTDATIRMRSSTLKKLVAAFGDPTVGVASGRDISVGGDGTEAVAGETGYVGYEMWVRSLESRLGTIIGASGCCYAMRTHLHVIPVPEVLSRDFAAAMRARRHGFRSVHVGDAVCLVPRTVSMGSEYQRKVRTMARGLRTLVYYRGLLNPLRHGGFALKLTSHKLFRWLAPLSLPIAAVGIALLAVDHTLARVALGLAVGGAAVTWLAVRRAPERAPLPRTINLFAFVVSSNVAVIAAWASLLTDKALPAFWEPTRRAPIDP